MYGPKYAWLILGDYGANWWRENESDLFCTPEQISMAINGYIATGLLETSTDDMVTVAGFVSYSQVKYVWINILFSQNNSEILSYFTLPYLLDFLGILKN